MSDHDADDQGRDHRRLLAIVAENEGLLLRRETLRSEERRAAAELARPGGCPPMAGARLIAVRDLLTSVNERLLANFGDAAELVGPGVGHKCEPTRGAVPSMN